MEQLIHTLKSHFSVWNVFSSFFWFEDRRLDAIKSKFDKRSDAEAIQQDFFRIGKDFQLTLDKIGKEKKHDFKDA